MPKTLRTHSLTRIIAAGALTWFMAAPALAAEPIRIAENDWTGNLIDINVAKIILEEHMGMEVELIFADYTGQWAGLAVGDLDVSMEIWPSFSFDAHEEWIDEKGAVEVIGDLGVFAKAGWYVPTYVIEGDAERGIDAAAPDLKTHEDLNQYAELFSRAETSGKGFYLSGVQTWEAHDEERIDNLGLNYMNVYAGSEGALVAEIESAYAKGEPLIMYMWTPHWVLAAYDLTEVELPAYTDECYGIGQEEPGDFACDFPSEMTYNVARVGFKDENPEAYAFFQNMTLSSDIQQEMLLLVDVEGNSVDEAVRIWMAANEDTWKAWIPASN
ncbi:MAG: ABC transporter substrate-binding protein [Rhodospirillaceae bacterium]|jgi:glycine betaine/proline transport system substrate-binding protein|nr:ABC transporter substrate-binding protein [Rhodospirillaceae bacterium]MBT7646548.1 ABC transporter substrate-binding protein [Rhodospirillaceae bacterium]